MAGLNRGEAVWILLCRLLEEPFDAMGLVASRFRGKSKYEQIITGTLLRVLYKVSLVIADTLMTGYFPSIIKSLTLIL